MSESQETAEEKPASVRRLFVQRMHREKRGEEWYETVKRLQADTGKQFGQVAGEAMRLMGYEGPEKEHELDAAYKQELAKKTKTTGEQLREEIRVEKMAANFEDAVAMLPDKASYQMELDWIRAHPAMARKTRTPEKTKDLIITVDDILLAPHGKAPSKSAVYALQHWCNCPHEFYKQLLGEHKKITEEEGAKNAASRDVGISEIERLLDEVSPVSVPKSPPSSAAA